MAKHADPSIAELGRRLAAVEEQLQSLQQQRERSVASDPDPRSSVAPDRLWAVEVLQGRSGPPFESDHSRGSLVYAGSVTAPGSGTVVWQIERPVPLLLEQEWDGVAPVLAALGHPVRLQIIRRLLAGARTSQDLQEIADLGTTGRLYHHVRELEASGLIVSPRRNHYAIRPEKIVPCLVIVAAAGELMMPPSTEVNPGESSDADQRRHDFAGDSASTTEADRRADPVHHGRAGGRRLRSARIHFSP